MVALSPLESWLSCPRCGQDMLTVAVAIATPPFVVELSGCANCGITSNEFAATEAAQGGPQGGDPERR